MLANVKNMYLPPAINDLQCIIDLYQHFRATFIVYLKTERGSH